MDENSFLNNHTKLQGYIMWAMFPKEEDIDEDGFFDDNKLLPAHPCLILFAVNQDINESEISNSIKKQHIITIFGTSKNIYDEHDGNSFYIDDKQMLKDLKLDLPTKWVIEPACTAKFPPIKKYFKYNKKIEKLVVKDPVFNNIEIYMNKPHIKRMFYDLIYKYNSYMLPKSLFNSKRYKE